MHAFIKGPCGVDLAAITKVRDAMLGGDRLDLLLAGHPVQPALARPAVSLPGRCLRAYLDARKNACV
jgi:hypothetical protein